MQSRVVCVQKFPLDSTAIYQIRCVKNNKMLKNTCLILSEDRPSTLSPNYAAYMLIIPLRISMQSDSNYFVLLCVFINTNGMPGT